MNTQKTISLACLSLSCSCLNFLSLIFWTPLCCFPPPFIATSHLPFILQLSSSQLDLEDTCPINRLLCHIVIMKKDFWECFYCLSQSFSIECDWHQVRGLINAEVIASLGPVFSLSCPSRWAWKGGESRFRREWVTCGFFIALGKRFY